MHVMEILDVQPTTSYPQLNNVTLSQQLDHWSKDGKIVIMSVTSKKKLMKQYLRLQLMTNSKQPYLAIVLWNSSMYLSLSKLLLVQLHLLRHANKCVIQGNDIYQLKDALKHSIQRNSISAYSSKILHQCREISQVVDRHVASSNLGIRCT